MLRAMVLLIAVSLPALGLLAVIGLTWHLFDKGGLLERWQTLIAGLLALGAAGISAYPMWKQLQRMSVQSNAVFRDFLDNKLRSLVAGEQQIEGMYRELNRALFEYFFLDDDPKADVNVHFAFAREQDLNTLVCGLRDYLEANRSPAVIEDDIRQLRSISETLSEQMRLIHYTTSTDQSGDDYAYSNDDWNDLIAQGAAAELEVHRTASQFEKATRKLEGAFKKEAHRLRDQIAQIDQILSRTAA